MHLWALLLAFLKANQFASGGVALAALATAWAVVRPVPAFLWRRLTNLAYVYIDVPNSDPLYGCMMRWLANHPRARRFRWVSAGTSPDTGSISGQAPVAIGDEVKSEIFFFPAPGTHFLTHRGRFGGGHRGELRRPVGEPEWFGLEHIHPKPDGGECRVLVAFKPVDSDGWGVLSLEPLTLSPSLLCRACGVHGFIREGRWVSA